jgi:chromosome partitioning protein
MMKTISVTSQKGGTGKTTVAENLAGAALQDGLTVVVVDLDPQTTATNWHDRRGLEQPSVVSCQVSRLRFVLDTARNEGADLVIIDTPPKHAEASLEAARAADVVIIPVRPQIGDLETLPAMRDILRIAGDPAAFVLINAAPHQGKRHEEAQEAAKSLGFSVCPVTWYQRNVYGDAPASGQTAVEFDAKSKAAQEVQELYKFTSNYLNKKT